jgi:hypothetical protein
MFGFVLEERAVFRLRREKKWHGDGGSMMVRNVGNELPDYTMTWQKTVTVTVTAFRNTGLRFIFS